jgi:hypothetical protein
VQRRDVLTGALAAISVYSGGALAQSETTGAKLIPWSDQPPPPSIALRDQGAGALGGTGLLDHS